MKRTIFAILCFLFVACTGDVATVRNIIDDIPDVVPQLPSDAELDTLKFVNKVYVDFDASEVSLSALPAGVTAQVSGTAVKIFSQVPSVEYVLKGASNDASLTLISERSPLVTLAGVNLNSVGHNALVVSSKEKIYLRGDGDADNILADAPSLNGKIDKQASVVSLMGDAVLCGGNICLQASRRDALLCTGVLYVNGATLLVENEKGTALNVTKGVVVASGEIGASSVKDVVKIKLGNLVMTGGTMNLFSSADRCDAVQARNVYVFDGVLSACVSGAAAKGIKAKESVYLLGGKVDVRTSGNALFREKKSDYSSASCIKSGNDTYIRKAHVSLTSYGDAGKGINCDGLLQIDGGSLSIKTNGDDVNHPIDLNAHASAKGIKCDSTVLVNGGKIEILVFGNGERCEGLESKCDIIIGGSDTELYIYSFDDAINSGRDFVVNGGKIFTYSVANDAIDSNGKITIAGGVVIANGTHSPEQGIDTDVATDFAVTGGTVVSIGGTMGPQPCLPSSAETSVPVVSWSGLRLCDGSFVNLSDGHGNHLLSYKIPRSMPDGALLMGAPSLKKGGEYSLSVSASVEGGEYAGCGLWLSPENISDVTENVTWEQSGLLVAIDRNGKAAPVGPATHGAHVTPPPPPAAAGAFPPPHAPAGFPPMPSDGNFPPASPHGFQEGVPHFPADSLRGGFLRNFDKYGPDNLPNRGW